nr:bcl-2-binding component 3, isoforms 1/2-like [Delphinus delphis]
MGRAPRGRPGSACSGRRRCHIHSLSPSASLARCSLPGCAAPLPARIACGPAALRPPVSRCPPPAAQTRCGGGACLPVKAQHASSAGCPRTRDRSRPRQPPDPPRPEAPGTHPSPGPAAPARIPGGTSEASPRHAASTEQLRDGNASQILR